MDGKSINSLLYCNFVSFKCANYIVVVDVHIDHVTNKNQSFSLLN